MIRNLHQVSSYHAELIVWVWAENWWSWIRCSNLNLHPWATAHLNRILGWQKKILSNNFDWQTISNEEHGYFFLLLNVFIWYWFALNDKLTFREFTHLSELSGWAWSEVSGPILWHLSSWQHEWSEWWVRHQWGILWGQWICLQSGLFLRWAQLVPGKSER